MRAPIEAKVLAELLPGEWNLAATNLPVWIRGERGEPHFSFELVSSEPLALVASVVFLDRESGRETVMGGTDTLHLDGFARRGKGLQRFAPMRWLVAGASDDNAIATLKYEKSMAGPAGIDILTRVGTEHKELRALVARSTEQFGLSPEDFGSLTWLNWPQAH